MVYFNTITFTDSIRIFNIQSDPAIMQGLLSFCIPIGGIFGSYFSNLLISRYSPKNCKLIMAYFAFGSTLFLLSGNIVVIVACRLMQGVYFGAMMVVRSVFVKEFTPMELAGKMGSLHQVMFSIGMIYAFVQTYLLSLFLTP